MPRLHYVSMASKRAVVATAIIGLILSVAVVVMIAERGRSQAAAHTRSAMPQMGFFGYWSEDEGFKSTVVINNASNTQVTVNPTLYSLSGHSLAVDPITLAPRRQLTANVADWLAQAGAGAAFKQGNLILNYEAPDAADLGAQVTVTNPESSLSFDFRNEMPMSFESSRLEGMWWQPDGASRYDLVLSNMKSSEVKVAVRTSGERGQSDGSSFDVELAPHQTQIINLDDKRSAFTTNVDTGKLGGISVTHTGAPGGVLAYGLLSKVQTGFSSHFPFEDPATSRSQTLAAAHVFVGKPDTPGFSKETRFTSIALIRNTSDAALDVMPSISFVYNNAPRRLSLDVRHLQPQQVGALDLAAELKSAGIRGVVSGAGLTLASTGSPGALMAHLTSYDQTRNHVFDVPMKDPAIKMNRFSGSYPFNLEGGGQSTVHVRNTTEEKARFTIQLDFEAESYTLPMQMLDPQQEAAIDIRGLRDSQTPDSIGRVIPREVTSGQVNWHEHGPQALIGRLEEFDVAQATASSFSCPGPGCCLSTEIVVTAPGSMSKVLGSTGHFKLLETRILGCDGTLYGPFDVSADASWSSTNSSVVTVGAVSSSGVLCSFVGVGQANVHADFMGIISQVDPISETCEGTSVPFPDDGPVQVVRITFQKSDGSALPTPLRVGITQTELNGTTIHNRTQHLRALVEGAAPSSVVIIGDSRVSVSNQSTSGQFRTFDAVGTTKSDNPGDASIKALMSGATGPLATASVSVVIPRSIATPHDKTGGGLVIQNMALNINTSPALIDVPSSQKKLVTVYMRFLTVIVKDQFGALIGDVYLNAEVSEAPANSTQVFSIGQHLTASSSYKDPVGAAMGLTIVSATNTTAISNWINGSTKNPLPSGLTPEVQRLSVFVDNFRLQPDPAIANRTITYSGSGTTSPPVSVTINW